MIMKHLLKMKGLLVILMALFLITGCDDNDNLDEIVDLGTFKVTLDEKVYDFTLVEALEIENYISIVGADAVEDTAIFTLMIDAEIEPGTYHLEADPATKTFKLKSKEEVESEFFAMWYLGKENIYLSYSGSLEVSEHNKEDKTIKGSFLLVMKNMEGETIDANDGKFNVKYRTAELPY